MRFEFWASAFGEGMDEWTFIRTNHDVYPSDPPPRGMCGYHRDLWMRWRDNVYRPQEYVPDPFQPRACTATHVQNRERRVRLNTETMEHVERLCAEGQGCA